MNTKASSLAALLAFGLFAAACGGSAPASSSTSTATAQSAATTSTPAPGVNPVLAQAVPTPEIEAMTKAVAALGPHTQANLPPIPFRGYAPPRPPDVVTAAFMFAAEHPEITSYVPCFCGCQQGGHKGNHDCFVRSRAANGDVIEWEEHGVECAVCIDVATRSRQLLASGASVQEIRTAIEREFVPTAQTMTPTPKPPAAHSH
ncbi:MAG TPA: PCYCGC motif-containing (lipo)protein [Vicinamibacterales bacterium]|nr:PCYCGC motif-containing (lipo)protein [Vicinamibacterales bacterium]